jgi:small subunit ribosomal protein S1
MHAVHPTVKRLSPPRELLEQEVSRLLGDSTFSLDAAADHGFLQSMPSIQPEMIIKGRVVSIGKSGVVIDIGAKSEGLVHADEFSPEELKIGTVVEVYIEPPEEGDNSIVLSKRKADRKRKWNEIILKHKEGDTVTGKVVRKIKGGLLVDIGVPVFLPASQVSLRRTKDINEYIGQELECEIIKIDLERENIVVSRRRMQEMQRERIKQALLSEIQEGEIREGVVKNIAEFGAFVDLGGIDGLLHITDMSWGRVQHPSELVQNNQEIQVKVLKVDRERERIALGLKQLTASPWEGITERYSVGSRHKGKVVNIMSYGAFVKLEDGIEGLVHISEMSWTRRVADPRDIVNLNDEVEVQVLGVNEEKQEISLGMKQLEENPWDKVHENYLPGKKIKGVVRNLTNYGAFIEIEPGIDGLLHVTDVSWTRKVGHPNEVMKKGDEIECVVLSVDTEKHRIALGKKQMTEDPWDRIIPEKFGAGALATGTVTKVTNFGVFVELDEGLEGLLHISELPEKTAEGFPKAGDPIKVRVIKLDAAERKIGLTLSNE